MRRILIFAGTTEGRVLAEILAAAGAEAVVCVATEYGEQVMRPLPGIALRRGRMDAFEMRDLMEKERFLAVVDATHPFATEVSENILRSAREAGLPLLRLRRDTSVCPQEAEKLCYVSSHEECVEALLRTEGNILLTTGSKDLSVYAEKEKLRERICARVLPSAESLSLCEAAGLRGRQIIAMQGPFSTEMNQALIRQYDIRVLVSKESGASGGLEEKIKAARQTGIPMFVVGNPERVSGLSLEQVCKELEERIGHPLPVGKTFSVTLIGAGMGDSASLTCAAKEEIRRADCIFGAPRMTERLTDWGIDVSRKKIQNAYLARDILPELEKAMQTGDKKAVVLFSGDSGFYSGCRTLYQTLSEWKEERDEEISVRILPGISSVSYFSAACGVSWQDMKLLSIHGRGESSRLEAEVLSAVRYHEKVMLLVSGAEDVRAVGRLLRENGLGACRVLVGYQLSYPEEKIAEYAPAECERLEEEGLYILLIRNEDRDRRFLAPCRTDEAFLRGEVPMTKEEVRELAVCKLRLTENAVVYDIGSGTGSVAVEIAGRSETLCVYAVERKEKACSLIRKNRDKFSMKNIEIVQGEAPECLGELPVPTHAFIGGSGGSLREIIKTLYRKNPCMRIVLTAVSLETVSEITSLLSAFPTREREVVQIQVSRAREIGKHHLMQAENPVCICGFSFAGGKGD